MAKIARATQLVFGSTAGANQIAQFGSFAAATPLRYSSTTATPALIQALSNYLIGWYGAVVGGNSPALEDMNALFFLITYQLAYGFQSGLPEWDSGTTYFIGSFVSSGGLIYQSTTDNNLNNPVTSAANWKLNGGAVRTITTSSTMLTSDDIVRSNTTAGSLTHTMPTIASSIGKIITIKDVGTGGFSTTVQANGSELIDGVTIYGTALNLNDAIRLFNNGTSWDVV